MTLFNSPSDYVATTMGALVGTQRAQAFDRLHAWQKQTGNRPMRSMLRRCLRRLADPRHRCTLQCWTEHSSWSLALDHPEQWRAPNGALVITAHPYGLTCAQREELANIARRTGAGLEIVPDGSWYWPGVTVLVVLTGRRPHAGKAPIVAAETSSSAKVQG